jgi:hypothetical protein
MSRLGWATNKNEPRAQISRPAVPVGVAWWPDPRLRQDPGPGHRTTGDRQQGRSVGDGYVNDQVAFDNGTRIAHEEALPEEQESRVISILSWGEAWLSTCLVFNRVMNVIGLFGWRPQRLEVDCALLR